MTLSRRTFLKFSVSSILLANTSFALATNKLIGHRVWPSDSYTRITLESKEHLAYKYFQLENPLRLVVDIEGIELKNELEDLIKKLSGDKYVKNLRFGINKPGVSRIVFELNEKIRPQIFVIDPVGEYEHRLVLDIYPDKDMDALFSELLEKEEQEMKTQISKQESKIERSKNPFIIAIDAGHGGEDPGAVGVSGTLEKNITLAIAKKLHDRMLNTANIKPILIRDDDYFIPLHHRVEKAKVAKADLFISIHADSFINKTAKGSSVFILSEKGATSAANKWLERKENSADNIGGIKFKTADINLAKTLLDLSLSATIMDSSKLAKHVLTSMSKINELHSNNIESAGFAVLKSPTIPSILVETAFLSNPEEEKKLKNNLHQDHIADAILEGISKYITSTPKQKTV